MRLLRVLLCLLAFPAMAQERLQLGYEKPLQLVVSPDAEHPVDREFSFELKAGDWLVAVAPSALVDFKAPGDDKALKASTEPNIVLTGSDGKRRENSGTLVEQVDVPGVWTLAIRGLYGVAIGRYPAGHHLLEPGISAQDVGIAAHRLGQPRIGLESFEPVYLDEPPPSGTPAALTVEIGKTMSIALYRRDAIGQVDLWADSKGVSRIWHYVDQTVGFSAGDPVEKVRRLLAGSGAMDEKSAMPVYPQGEWEQDFVAQRARVQGKCFDFIRYIAHRTQEDVTPYRPLAYVALGLSRDGQWLATATAQVEHVRLAEEPAESVIGKSPSYVAALTKRLEKDPDALSPPMRQLDAVIASLDLPRCIAP